MTTPQPKSQTPPIELGPFELVRLLGSGGGGTVWLGRHRAQRILVATKVMTAAGVLEKAFRARFVEEVRAVARLDHPGIVTIVDYGSINAEAERASGGKVKKGSPYLVMEFARAGTLISLEPLRNFSELRRILISILDALAHAHARGVIHRDIKPGNVLVSRSDRRLPGIKLSDFGIAYAMEQPHGRFPSGILRIRAGTPSYMAPEQIRGDLKNQGPWTDLYAVGCLAFRLATGRTPFSVAGRDVDQILGAHLHAVVPPLASRFSVPLGFGEWIGTLLAKAPWRRFQCCADAVRALHSLDEFPMPQIPVHQPGNDNIEPTGVESTSTEISFDEDIATLTLPQQPPTASETSLPMMVVFNGSEPEADEPFRTAPLPVPETWRHRTPPPKPLQLVGAGLGLFGLRPVPLTGREAERDSMWASFRDAQRTGEAGLVVLRGASGVGKSRLAEWITQRSLELGCAEVLRATHSSFPGPADGLSHMLAETIRCGGLAREQTDKQVRHVLTALSGRDLTTDDDLTYVALALTEIIRPGQSHKSAVKKPRIHFSSQAERYAVVHRFLREKCRARPVLLWFDDVQWGREALGLTQYLLEAPFQLPLLIIVTVRDEALADCPVESALISRLTKLERTRTIELQPLSVGVQLELIGALLGLEEELAFQVQQRTLGNPLFAVQLVGDWVERGVLEVSDEGFRLREGELAELPDDIHDMWRRRIDLLVSRFEGDIGLQALEMAAAMGDDIDASEWRLACELAGMRVPEGIDEAMVERRLALRSDVSWSFAHTMLRESLERTGRKAGRWKKHHRSCVRALRHLHHGDDTGVSERIALHLLAAGETEEAIEPLLTAADQHQRFGDFDRALVLCDRREAALTELEVEIADSRWAEGWLMAARCTYKQAEFDAAEAYLDKVEANLEGEESSPVRANAWRIRAQVTRMRGDMRQALTLAEQASAEFNALGDLQSAADCDVIMARLHLESTGDHRKGLGLATSAQERLKDFDDHGGLAECAYIMGHLFLAIGDVAAAESSAIEARRLYELVGNRFGMAACANFHGEIARNQADFVAAERHYLSAVTILESIGSKATFVPRLNLALVLVQREAFDDAEPVLLALEEEGRAGKHAVLCYAHYALMACYASASRWDEWDEQYELAREYRPETGRVDQDLANMAQRAGDFATKAGFDERAQAAYKLALEHWQALDKPEKVDDVQKKLA